MTEDEQKELCQIVEEALAEMDEGIAKEAAARVVARLVATEHFYYLPVKLRSER